MDLNNKLAQALELQNQGNADKAQELFAEILGTDPNNAVALYSLALIFLNAGRHSDALPLTMRGVQANPLFAPLWFIHGAVLQALGDKAGALQSYDQALQVKPDYLEVLTNSGVLLRSMMRHKESLERFQRVLAIDPNHQTALANSGILLTEFKQSQPAIAMFARLLAINPDYDYGMGLLAYERLHICDWTDFAEVSKRVVEGIRAGKRTCKTLALMAISDSASDHYQAARMFGAGYCPPASRRLWQGERYRHDRIRVAYISPDLREHPVGHLMAGIFEHHDKARFETIAISLGIDDGSRLRERMLRAFDRFIDMREMGSLQVAQMLRDMEIDILVDLGGYTSDTRTDILAYRPVPVQVNYLGYPGTMGVEYYDYILADPHIIPPGNMQYYTEKVVYLPDTYMPTDNSVKISERTPSRAECGLPDQGFVFCAFCHDYKINPNMFDVWMRLLKNVPGSVLWLVSRNETSQHNLKVEAERRGISGDRLIFAKRVPLVEDHLARYRQANLFLDTHPYNGHTTTADALMAGLPVLTYMGESFPSRVAGGLLHTVGLPDMVARSYEEYEAKALQLASDPGRLEEVRTRLAKNKSGCSLFDTRQFCGYLEAAYISMWRKSQLGAAIDEL